MGDVANGATAMMTEYMASLTAALCANAPPISLLAEAAPRMHPAGSARQRSEMVRPELVETQRGYFLPKSGLVRVKLDDFTRVLTTSTRIRGEADAESRIEILVEMT